MSDHYEPLKGAQAAPRDYRLRADTASFIGGGLSSAAQSYRGGAGGYPYPQPRRADAFVSPSAARSIEEAVRAGETVDVIVGERSAPPGFFADLHDLLAELDHVVGTADAVASDLRSRLFGPWPVAGEQASGANNLATTTVCDAALETVRAITRRARGLSESAHVLEAKL